MIRSSSMVRPINSDESTCASTRRTFWLEPALFILPAGGSVVAVKHDAIFAHVLRLVQRTIGGGDNIFRGVDERRKRRNADAHSHATQRLRLSVRKVCRVDALPDAIRDRARFRDGRLRQQNAELFAAVSRG